VDFCLLDAEAARRIQRQENLAPDRTLAWAIARCPAVQERMREAAGPETNFIAADFSYHCRPYAGQGYFLVGDAAAFMDPIFSTGVSVAFNSAIAVARFVDDMLAGRIAPARARAIYISQLEQSTGALFHIIRQYYDHAFRELFLEGKGPLGVHKAVIGVLGGNVFPRPPWKLRWRLWLFDRFVKRNRKKRIVRRRRRFSLLKGVAAPTEPVAAAT